MVAIKNKKIQGVIAEIIDQYAYADTSKRPWIIGFSGGKDSTVLLTLVWKALEQIRLLPTPFQLRRPVYVVCNDTMVENPIISAYVEEVLRKIEIAARDQGIPVIVKKTTPKLEDTFWTNLIGRGYPAPNNSFRWCTDRLKITPTSDFLHEQIDKKGEAIVLLGTRYGESTKREKSIKKYEIAGSRLSRHASDLNTWVYAPIKELMLEEVWYIINTVPSPWDFDNSILFQIYADASADDYECPTVVTNSEHSSCGQSRFGCWTCTVVKKDKSMSSLINNGQEWLKPLLEFRDRLVEERNISDNRLKTRRNGQIAVDEEGNNQGTYAAHYKARILRELLELEKKVQIERPYIKLITNQELIAIQVLWHRDGIFEYKVGDIYRLVYNKELNTNNLKALDATERRILKEVCGDEIEYYHLIDNLMTVQESKSLLISKYGLHNDVENIIEGFVNPKDK